jgi:hypothetical protein
LIQGVLIGWTVFIGVVLAAIFLGPPLWFNEVQTGYLYTGAFIGAILGLIFSGALSDWSANLMIKLNKGRYEPEFRILLVIPQLVFSGIGLYGFAFVAGDVTRYGWLTADVFFMFVLIGMVMGAVASALYIVDAHREFVTAPEFFSCVRTVDLIANFLHRPNRHRSLYVSSGLQEHLQLHPYVLCLRLGCPRRPKARVHHYRKHPGWRLPSEHPNV